MFKNKVLSRVSPTLFGRIMWLGAHRAGASRVEHAASKNPYIGKIDKPAPWMDIVLW